MDGINPGPARRDHSSPFAKRRDEAEPRKVNPLTGEVTGARDESKDRPAFVMEVRGLAIDRALSYDEWVGMIDQLRAIEHGYQWWIGDALNYGEAAYGEKYANAVSPKQADTWKTYASITGQYEKWTRVHFLDWTLYRIVAYVEEPRRSELLARAVKERLTTRELTALKNGVPPGNEPSERGDPPAGMTFHPLYIEGARSLIQPRLNDLLSAYDANAVIHVDYYVVGNKGEDLP